MESRKGILVLDFGGQYTHLIARRIRELGVYSEILPPTAETKELKKAKGIILSGGPYSVYEENAPTFNSELFSIKKPILGLCYGHQLIANELGGKVNQWKTKEFGSAELIPARDSILFKGLDKTELVWMSHGDTVAVLPHGFRKIGSTFDCDIAAAENKKRKIFGLQFHPEVTHTEHGMKILKNFVFRICKAKKNWNMGIFLREKVKELKRKVRKKKVFMLTSGGVDSTVCLALLAKALEKKMAYAVHLDTGFMRKQESKNVIEQLNSLGIEVKLVDASKRLLSKLKGVWEPEKKRKIIGDLFVNIASRELRKIDARQDEWLLCQGTIYPDTIETGGTTHSAKIKTHHNRVESMLQLIDSGMVIEPISELYKDEVRELGERLALPEEIIWRHPFPGPGLAIRIICSKGVKTISSGEAELRANEIANEFGFSAKVLPVKAVGVQGDSRTYKNVVALGGELDWETLGECSRRITNEISDLNRVVYNCSKPISKIKSKRGFLTKRKIALLQEADSIVMEEIKNAGLHKEIWQFPVILLPLDIDESGTAIVLRPVASKEAMTARFAPLEKELLEKIVKRILSLKGIASVFYDVTNKPPATIEWE